MTVLVFKLFGGVGLFLMGMVLLADGIKSFAGDALRDALVRFTGRPLKAFVSGALVTALVQSSSATTIAVIGFVSAGLITFPQSVGVVLGASLGTTATSWIVAVLGLKVSIGFYALPMVGAGAFMKLLSRGRWKSFGFALAGFGLIFIGIETLQDGMKGLSGVFNLAALPSSGIFTHILIILIGFSMTVIMQSSSAAVATIVTALHTDSVAFEQAAYLVIGAAIGTTATGILASIGAHVTTKRTALAHVLFNVATGVIAVFLLPFFLVALRLLQQTVGLGSGAVSLAAFHTLFIGLGAFVFLPFTDRFSHWIERLLPERSPTLTRHLDDSVLSVPSVALEATRRALRETASLMFAGIRDQLTHVQIGTGGGSSQTLERTLFQIQQFFGKIPPVSDDQPLSRTRVAQLHAIDHLMRLLPYRFPPMTLHRMKNDEELRKAVERCREILSLGESGLRGIAAEDWLETVETLSVTLSRLHHRARPAVLRETASGGNAPMLALDILDALRWLDRLGYHTWRICYYLGSEESAGFSLGEAQAAALE